MQFFTWDSKHASLSWWKHFEEELPRLAQLGITQVWLPPPNKAAEPVRSSFVVRELHSIFTLCSRNAERQGIRRV